MRSVFKFDVVKRLIMRHNFGFGDDEYVIGHIGKFMEAKNHSFLIEVFAKYHALQPKSKLLLIGDGELRHLVEAAIDKNKVNDCVILAGLRSDIPDVLQAIDIFLFPSIYEGMPLSVVEAQASGLPCIISDAVTKMVNIGEDVIQLPLSKGADYWAEYLGNVKYELSRQERCERNTELITKAGYNIETEAENLMRIYKKLVSIKYDISLSQSHLANREMDVSRTFRNEKQNLHLSQPRILPHSFRKQIPI